MGHLLIVLLAGVPLLEPFGESPSLEIWGLAIEHDDRLDAHQDQFENALEEQQQLEVGLRGLNAFESLRDRREPGDSGLLHEPDAGVHGQGETAEVAGVDFRAGHRQETPELFDSHLNIL